MGAWQHHSRVRSSHALLPLRSRQTATLSPLDKPRLPILGRPVSLWCGTIPTEASIRASVTTALQAHHSERATPLLTPSLFRSTARSLLWAIATTELLSHATSEAETKRVPLPALLMVREGRRNRRQREPIAS